MIIQAMLKVTTRRSLVSSATFWRPLNICRSVSDMSYRHNISKKGLIYLTVGQTVTAAAKQYGDKECVVSMHEGIRYNFHQINEMASFLAAGLLETGLKRGDRLGICAPNYFYWYISFLAAARVGIILVTLNPAYQVPELKYCINKVGMKGIIAPENFLTQQYYKMLLKVAPELSHSAPGELKSESVPTLSSVIIAGDGVDLPGCFMLNKLSTSRSCNEVKELENNVQADDGFIILFTSGTTGKPKAVLLNHFSVVNNALFSGQRLYKENDRVCLQVPFFHTFGVNTIIGGLLHGVPLILESPRFIAGESLKAIGKEKCTVLEGTPTMYHDLINKQNEVNANLTSLRMALVAGAPCSPELYGEIAHKLKIKEIFSAYGMTELSGVVFTSVAGEHMDLTTNTVGYLMDHTEVKIVDNRGNIVPLGTPGELLVKYYGTMLGYFDDLDKTYETISHDQWLRTGDIFILEPNGYGRIVGRIKEMIIRGGENIYPREIEEIINAHPNVIETQVVGVSDVRMGEEVFAFVRIKNDTKFEHKDLQRFCEGKISHFKIPKYMKIVDVFPKTAAGKVQKYQLKALAEKLVVSLK